MKTKKAKKSEMVQPMMPFDHLTRKHCYDFPEIKRVDGGFDIGECKIRIEPNLGRISGAWEVILTVIRGSVVIHQIATLKDCVDAEAEDIAKKEQYRQRKYH